MMAKRKGRAFGVWFRVLAVIHVLALAVIWIYPEMQLQARLIWSVGTLALWILATVIGWLIVAWRLGVFCLLLMGGAIGYAVSEYEIVDVTGDLIPIVRRKGTPALEPRERVRRIDDRVGVTWSAPENGVDSSYPEFLGHERRGIVESELKLATDWEASEPTPLWRREIGASYSGFAIHSNYAVTQEQSLENPNEELITAYHSDSGDLLWKYGVETRYESAIAGVGPRATPTIHEGVVYAFGATGWLSAVTLDTGTPVWSRSLAEDYDARAPEWGFASAPLVVDDKVVVCVGAGPGMSTMAFELETGELAWASGDAPASWSSPVYRTLLGVPQILMFNQRELLAHRPQDGEILWRHPWEDKYPNVAVPLALGDDAVVLSAGYGNGAERVDLTRVEGRFEVSSHWKTRRLKCKFGSLFLYEGYIYGLDDGTLTCIDPATGDRVWKDGRYGHGQMVLVNDLFIITGEYGDLALVRPNPEERVELARITVFEDKSWNPPAISGETLYLRNHVEAVALRLPTAPEAAP